MRKTYKLLCRLAKVFAYCVGVSSGVVYLWSHIVAIVWGTHPYLVIDDAIPYNAHPSNTLIVSVSNTGNDRALVEGFSIQCDTNQKTQFSFELMDRTRIIDIPEGESRAFDLASSEPSASVFKQYVSGHKDDQYFCILFVAYPGIANETMKGDFYLERKTAAQFAGVQ